MPGIDGSNVSVLLEDDVLSVSGKQRQIPLPDDIDTERPEASYRDGVLTVRVPKTKVRGDAHEIPVQTQQAAQQTGQQTSKERAA